MQRREFMAGLGGLSAMALLGGSAAAQATPATNAIVKMSTASHYHFRPDTPLLLFGERGRTFVIDVDAPPAQGFLDGYVAYTGNGRFQITVTPAGAAAQTAYPAITAIHPIASYAGFSAQSTGSYNVDIEADAPWAWILGGPHS